jgi:hypothetical protein
MLGGIRSRLTYANVMATVAVFIALGGVAWAAATINSKDVIDNSLKSADLKNRKGVKGADVVPDSLKGTAVDEASLGPLGSEGWQAGQLLGTTACQWVNFGNGFNDAGYFRDPAGVVHLKGMVVATDSTFGCNDLTGPGAATVRQFLFLPAGYRPERPEVLATISNNAPARVTVQPEAIINPDVGVVEIEPNFPTTANAKAWVSIDGLSFRCGPSGEDGCP